jgi:hypothetical protein
MYGEKEAFVFFWGPNQLEHIKVSEEIINKIL